MKLLNTVIICRRREIWDFRDKSVVRPDARENEKSASNHAKSTETVQTLNSKKRITKLNEGRHMVSFTKTMLLPFVKPSSPSRNGNKKRL